MDGIEQSLGKILNDPAAMSQIMSLAQSLRGSMGPAPEPDVSSPPQPAPPPTSESSGLPNMESLLQMVQTLRQAGRIDDRQAALFQALKPFVTSERQAKLDRALQISRLAHMAGYALNHYNALF